MMTKPAKKGQHGPGFYRLTLTRDVFSLVVASEFFKVPFCTQRPDGKWNVAISMTVKDQIETEAKPGEDWSDTVLRMVAK